MENKSSHSLHLLKPITNLFKKFHLTIFFVFIIACLSSAIILLSNTLQNSSTDPAYTSSINAGAIDETTLNRLNSLHTSAQNAPAHDIPAGRINAFNE